MKHTEFARAELDVTQLICCVVQITRMIFARLLTVAGVLIKESLGSFDSGESQIPRPDAVPVIFYHHQVEPGGVKDTQDDDGEEGDAPKQTHKNGSMNTF